MSSNLPPLPWTADDAEAAMSAVPETDAAEPASRAATLSAPRLDRADLLLAIRCLDLTSLRGDESEQEVVELCERAVRPSSDPQLPSAAAVVVYAPLIRPVAERLRGTGVRAAAVAGGFPSADAPLEERLEEVREAVTDGADEIDTVIPHRLLQPGRYGEALAELSAIRAVCDGSSFKVILETGLLSPADVRRAAVLATAAGADFIKSSTGKREPGATPEAALLMCEAVRDLAESTGRRVGVKVSGGIRTPQDAATYVALVREVLGEGWLSPDRFRIGASTLLSALVEELGADRPGPAASDRS